MKCLKKGIMKCSREKGVKDKERNSEQRQGIANSYRYSGY